MKTLNKMGKGAFHTSEGIIRDIKLLRGVRTKITSYRSKDIIRVIKCKKKGGGVSCRINRNKDRGTR